MHKATVLSALPGHVIPEPLLTRVLEAGKNTIVGFLSFNGDKLLVQRSTKLEGVRELCETFKEDHVVLVVQHSEDGVDKEDLQPFLLLGEEQQPELVMLAAGKFTNQAIKDSKRPPACHMLENVLTPALEEVMGECDTVDEFLDKLSEPENSAALNTLAEEGEGQIILLTAARRIKTFSKDGEGYKFEWGTASEVFGYQEKEFPEKETPIPKSTLKLKKRIEVAPTPPASASSVPAVPAPKPGDGKVVNAAEAEAHKKIIPLAKNPYEHLVQAPPAYLKDKKTKQWYYRHAGFLPENPHWSTKPAVLVKTPDKRQLEDPNSHFRVVPAKGKDVVPNHVPQTVDMLKPEEKNEPLRVPHKQTESFKIAFLAKPSVKAAMEAATVIPTIQEIEAYEKKIPSFSERTGLDIERTLGWRFEDRLAFCVDYPHLTAILLGSYAMALSKAWQGKEFLKTHVKTQTTEEVVAPVKPKLLKKKVG